MSKYLELRGRAPKTENENQANVSKKQRVVLEAARAGIKPPSPILKHSGIGPANLGGPGMKSHVHACGTPKKSSAFNKLEDLSGDGKVTQKDVLIGRGVINKDGSKKS